LRGLQEPIAQNAIGNPIRLRGLRIDHNLPLPFWLICSTTAPRQMVLTHREWVYIKKGFAAFIIDVIN
jgi:hypothetical protein